jgi:hypothetical protein
MSMLWNDLDDHNIEQKELRRILESSPQKEENTVSELKDELYDLWDQSYWKQRQWTEVSPLMTHASAE